MGFKLIARRSPFSCEPDYVYPSNDQNHPDNLDTQEALPQEHNGEKNGHHGNKGLIHGRPRGPDFGDPCNPKDMGHRIAQNAYIKQTQPAL